MNIIAAIVNWFYAKAHKMDEEWRHVPTPNIACRRWGTDYL